MYKNLRRLVTAMIVAGATFAAGAPAAIPGTHLAATTASVSWGAQHAGGGSGPQPDDTWTK